MFVWTRFFGGVCLDFGWFCGPLNLLRHCVRCVARQGSQRWCDTKAQIPSKRCTLAFVTGFWPAGSIHHVMWYFPAKSWPKHAKHDHITWRPWAFKASILWHKIITSENFFRNNYFVKITNFTRNSKKMSLFLGDFVERAKRLKNYEKINNSQGIVFVIILCQRVRAACLQNETAPEKCLNRYEKRFEKREKRIRKTIRNAFETKLAPLRPLKIFHRHFSTNFKSFSPPKISTKKSFFSPRGSAGGGGGHANRGYFRHHVMW